MRAKWDERRGQTTYGRYTINKVLGLFGACDFYRNGKPHEEPDAREHEAIDDPHRLARVFLDGHFSVAGEGDGEDAEPVRTLVYYLEDFYEWDGRAFRKNEDVMLALNATSSIKEEFDRAFPDELATYQRDI